MTQNTIGMQIAGTPYGTGSTNSSSNTVTKNWIEQNQYFIDTEYGAANNAFYHNNFINNTNQITGNQQYPIYFNPGPFGDNGNVWDNGKEGNYWNNYSEVDTNHDGIGDTPFSTYAGYYYNYIQDNFPLMQPYQ